MKFPLDRSYEANRSKLYQGRSCEAARSKLQKIFLGLKLLEKLLEGQSLSLEDV